MKKIQSIVISEESNEECLPDFWLDFPYIASYAELDKYYGSTAPWHWHPAVELFYMESGTLEYTTPNGKWIFPAGSGGLVNSNVLHMTKVVPSEEETIQLLHIFETDFLSGGRGNRMETKYIHPLTSTNEIEIIPLFPDDTGQADLLKKIRTIFDLNENQWAYEFKLRQQLTEVWLQLFEMSRSVIDTESMKKTTDHKVKEMMEYIHTHYQEKITVEQPDKMNDSKWWIDLIIELQSLAQAGLTYGKDAYDQERYQRNREISAEMMSAITELPTERVKGLFCNEIGYQTPKIDTRAVEKLNENPKNCLVLEDSEAGIEASYSANIPVICIPDMKKPAMQYLDKTAAVYETLDKVIVFWGNKQNFIQ